MGPPHVESVRGEVRDAYASVTRLRVYVRLTLMVSAVFFVATAGAMVVGWLPVDEGVLGLVSAVLIATATAAKFYDGVHRTNLYAMDLERTLPGQDRLDGSSVARQSVKTFTVVGLALTLVAGAGILGYSFTNADSQQPITGLSQAFVTEDERDDDDDEDGQGDDAEDSDDSERESDMQTDSDSGGGSDDGGDGATDTDDE